MKQWILTLVLTPTFALAAQSELVTCQLKDPKACNHCEKRIPASCENHAFNGSLDANRKPLKIQWKVSNTEAGTEKIVTTANKKLTLKSLQAAKDLKKLSAQTKLKVSAAESVSLHSVQLASNTALYKDQKGSAVVAKLKPKGHLRTVASTQDPMAGGVKRAQAKSQSK